MHKKHFLVNLKHEKYEKAFEETFLYNILFFHSVSFSLCGFIHSMDIPQNCILTQEELLNNPSLREGLSEEEEFKYRCFACELIRDGCILLELYCCYFHSCNK